MRRPLITIHTKFILFALLQILPLSVKSQDSLKNLDDYFKVAVGNSPQLKAEYKAYEAALQQLPQVSSLSDPTFSFGYFISPVETRVGPQYAKLSLNQMFPWFGTLKAKENVAALEAESRFQSFLDVRNKLYWELAMAYYLYYENNKLQSLEEENIEVLSHYKSLAERKLSNSEGSMVDVLRVDIMIDDAETELSLLKQKEKPLLASFQNVINKDLEIEIPDSIDLSNFKSQLVEDSIFNSHPLIKEIKLKEKSFAARAQLAHKQGLPKLGVGLDYVLVGKRNDVTIADNGKDVFMPMVSISLPIFRKKYNAQKKQATLMQESYQMKKESLINKLDTDYEETKYSINQQLEYINLYKRQIDKIENTLTLQIKTYAGSGIDFEELLRSRQQLIKYKKLKAQAEVKYSIQLERYNYLLSKVRD